MQIPYCVVLYMQPHAWVGTRGWAPTSRAVWPAQEMEMSALARLDQTSHTDGAVESAVKTSTTRARKVIITLGSQGAVAGLACKVGI